MSYAHRMDKRSALRQAIAVAGSQTKLAAKLGIRQPSIAEWLARNTVPIDRCTTIEALTGVRCEQLRPDVYWSRGPDGTVMAYTVPVRAA